MRSLIARSISSQMSASLRCSLPFREGGISRDLSASPNASLFFGALALTMVGGVLLAPSVLAQGATQKATAGKGPIVSILSPQYADQLKGTVQVLVGVEARQFAPQSIEMLVDGVSATEGPVKLETFPSANFTWDTTRFSDGPHRLTVVVTDTQGFRGSSEVNVYINNGLKRDAIAPDLMWLNVKSGDTWRGIVDLNLKVVDNFGVKYLFVMLNPASEPLKTPAAHAWFLNRPPYNVRFDSRNAADGQYTLRALAYDALENEGISPSVNINIANRSINPTYIAPNNAGRQAPDLKSSQSNVLGNATQAQPIPVAPQPQATDSPGENEPIVADQIVPDATDTIATQSAPTPQATQAAAPSNANRVARSSSREAAPPTVSQPDFVARGGAPANPITSAPRADVRPALAGGRLNANDAIARANSRDLPATGEVETSRVAPNAGEGSRAASAPTRRTPRNVTLDRKSALPQGAPRTLPRLAINATSTKATEAAVVSAPMENVESRIGNARDAQTNRANLVHNRLSAIDAAQRTIARAAADSAPALSAAVVDARSGSISSVSASTAKTVARIAGGKAVRPQADERGNKTRLAARSNNNLLPLSPAKLPVMASQNGTPEVSNSSSGIGQGSVTAPVFPNPSLSAPVKSASGTQRAVPPLLAALPSPSMARRVSGAAITVTPMAASTLGALPKMHRVLAGQNLGWVAAHYKLPVDVLAVHNAIDAKAPLKAGQTLSLPQSLTITFGGQPVTGDVAAMMVGSTGVTPFRFMFEKQGGTLKWDEKNGRVTARNATHEVTLAIGSKSAMVNKKEVMLDLAAFLVSGRTMVPIRFFEKALQARVEWEPATGRLFVAMSQ